LKSSLPVEVLQSVLCSEGIFAGVEVEEGLVNFCVTEKHSKEDLDRVADILGQFVIESASSVISSQKLSDDPITSERSGSGILSTKEDQP